MVSEVLPDEMAFKKISERSEKQEQRHQGKNILDISEEAQQVGVVQLIQQDTWQWKMTLCGVLQILISLLAFILSEMGINQRFF